MTGSRGVRGRLVAFGFAFLSAAVACTGEEDGDGRTSGDGDDLTGDGDGDPSGDGDASGDGDRGAAGDGDGDELGDGDGGASGDGDGDAGSGEVVLLPPSTAPELSYCPLDETNPPSDYEGRPVLRVCRPDNMGAGCDYSSMSEAMGAAASGDRIEVVAGGSNYDECVVVDEALTEIEIAGVCGRPHFTGTVCQSKGVFVHYGRNLTLTNVEVSGAAISAGEGGNAAAVRDQSLGGLNLRYVYFHDNQNGLLGGVGEVNIDWSRFEANGSSADPGYTHNIYLDSAVTHLRIQNSLFLRAAYEGNNMKTRAQRMTFRCSVSASLDGADSREMDISEGGEVLIQNSLIQQGAASVNSGMVGFATESEDPDRRHATQSITIEQTDFINDKATGTFVAYNAYDTAVTLDGVRFVGSGTTLNNTNGGADTVSETNVTTWSDRTEADLPLASDDHMDLPPPPGCPSFEYF